MCKNATQIATKTRLSLSVCVCVCVCVCDVGFMDFIELTFQLSHSFSMTFFMHLCMALIGCIGHMLMSS